MSENKEEIRYILKFYYKKEKNASCQTQTAKKICDVYGHDTVSVRMAMVQAFSIWKFWCQRPRSGRPITEKIDEIMEKVIAKPVH